MTDDSILASLAHDDWRSDSDIVPVQVATLRDLRREVLALRGALRGLGHNPAELLACYLDGVAGAREAEAREAEAE